MSGILIHFQVLLVLGFAMSASASIFNEVYPKSGEIYHSDVPTLVLCKPKILPLKSITLEKIEQMQKKAQDGANSKSKQESGDFTA